MSRRPAGYSSESSDDDDEFGHFSFSGDIKSEKERREDSIADSYRKRLEEENTSINRLYSALINGDLDSVKQELDNGVDVNCKVTADWTALYLASSQVSDIIVEELLKRGANVNTNRDGSTTVMAACNYPKDNTSSSKVLSTVQQLFNYGAKVAAIDRKRRTAFMLACAQGFSEVVTFLLPLSTLEQEDNQGWTALFYAANADEAEIVEILLNSGANLDHNDNRSNNVKYYASLNECQKVLFVLPKDEITEDDLATEYDYENMFKNLENSHRPGFQKDIPLLLYGMQSYHLTTFFHKTNVDLHTFLHINVDKLKELGINMSFQRNRILHGQYLFHIRPWTRGSMPVVPKENFSNTYDIFTYIVTTVKHLSVLEASLKYVRQQLDMNAIKNKTMLSSKIKVVLEKMASIERATNLLNQRASQVGSTSQSAADLITSRFRFEKNRMKQKIAYGLTSISVFFIINFC